MHFGHPKAQAEQSCCDDPCASTSHTSNSIKSPFEGWTQLSCGIIAIATQHIPEIEAKRQLGLRHGDTSINNRWLQHQHQDGSHYLGRAPAPHRHGQADLAKLAFWEFFQMRLACKAWNRLASDETFLLETFPDPIPSSSSSTTACAICSPTMLPPATGLGHHYPVWSIGVITSPLTNWATSTTSSPTSP